MRSTEMPVGMEPEDMEDGITAQSYVSQEFEAFIDRLWEEHSIDRSLSQAVVNDYLNNTNAHVEAWDQDQAEALPL